MSKIDDQLDRLFRGAAKATEDGDPPLPFGLVDRVIAAANSAPVDEVELAVSLVCQRVLLCAFGVVVACLCVNLPDIVSGKTWTWWNDPRSGLIESVARLEVP
jgi:hypothetical protein